MANINPLLQHVPEEIVNETVRLCGVLFDDGCCSEFIQKLNIPGEKCLHMFMIKLLGYGIILMGSIVKLPQVLKIFGAKSGVGLSLFGVLLELMAITFTASYSFRNNFPMSAWGECIALGAETALIAYMILWYDGHKAGALSFLLMYTGIIYALTHPLFPKDLVWYLQSSVVYLAVSGKLMQALKNYKAQHTGQLSALSAWAIFAGSLARILTTIKETGDLLTTITFICSSCSNAVIATQVLWYWKSTQAFMEKGKKKKAN
uniref:Solute carrier family 66 member 3 n=1 Tax=Aceria tosichella TaxID=561515 RepID=A0A6G1S5Q5_9ACAR